MDVALRMHPCKTCAMIAKSKIDEQLQTIRVLRIGLKHKGNI